MASSALTRLRVPVRQLRRECDEKTLRFRTTADLAPLQGTVGQDRAVAAMDFGLSIEADGYNLYVAGPSGTGRSTELITQIERVAKGRPVPRDWCYVFNFSEPALPKALSLPAGRGHELGNEVDQLIATLRKEIPGAFESDEYAQRREVVLREAQSQRERFFATLEHEARARGLAVSATPSGISTVPVVDDKPLTKEQYDQLPDAAKHDIQERTKEFDTVIAQLAPQLRRLDRESTKLLVEVDRQLVMALAAPLIDELKQAFAREPMVVGFIEALAADIADHIDDLRATDDAAQPQPPGGMPTPTRDGVYNRYKVNILVTHRGAECAPAVTEESPSYYRMFGRVDYRSSFGSMVTDHTMIKPGALHRANGGFLIVDALDLVRQPLVWETLKRALRTKQIRLENMGDQFSVIPTATLTPEAIPLEVKVALIGTSRMYQVLQAADDDFGKLFKAKADFAMEVDRTAEQVALYAQFVARQAQDKGMRPFERAAVAQVIEHGSRLVADQRKLSLRMADLVDLLVEADYWACEEGSKHVKAGHVEQAIERKAYRSSLIEDRLQEMITDGMIKVDVTGEVVGQVNGLSVYDTGDYSFGRPSRITARVSLGRGQVINLERETQRSGPSHTKGFLILNGYINGKFAHRQPLSFAASIAFEQMYDEVDGDSASSTELYALLSAITDVPLRQNIAVTGSVNQLGEVQAIGGVNQKIEGFYAVCKARGLTGGQGVMIPKDNVRNLMLKPEVVGAIKADKFHVWAVATIEQGIELLTGIPAGKLGKNVTYPTGTIFRRVTDALATMTRRAIEVNRAAQKELVGNPKHDNANGTRNRHPKPEPGSEDAD